MKNILKLFLLCLIIQSAQAFETKTFSLDLPAGWDDQVDLFGLPYIFLGPEGKYKRPTLGVIPSGNKDISISGTADKKTIETFNNNKKNWVTTNGGSIIEFLPYEKVKLKTISDVHRFGVRYKLGALDFKEFSYYFHCGKELFLVKSLADDKDTEGSKQLENVVMSLGCKV